MESSDTSGQEKMSAISQQDEVNDTELKKETDLHANADDTNCNLAHNKDASCDNSVSDNDSECIQVTNNPGTDTTKLDKQKVSNENKVSTEHCEDECSDNTEQKEAENVDRSSKVTNETGNSNTADGSTEEHVDSAGLESFEDESGSDDSGSEGEYESAEEGEELHVDAQRLQDIEESLTEEEKEERRQTSQALKEEGNELYKSGSYKSAIRTYSRALRQCPLKFKKERAIMYSNRAACKLRLEDKEEAIRDCSKALDLHPHYTKAQMRRAELYEATDKLEEALKDYQNVLELDPSQHNARAACMRLPDQIKERNEKLKEEMMGKLKDLGNMVLRPFGLSTNNFQLNQDPNTGGYSVNFVQGQNNNSS